MYNGSEKIAKRVGPYARCVRDVPRDGAVYLLEFSTYWCCLLEISGIHSSRHVPVDQTYSTLWNAEKISNRMLVFNHR